MLREKEHVDVSDLNVVVYCQRTVPQDSFSYKIVRMFDYRSIRMEGERFFFFMKRCSPRGTRVYKNPYMNDMSVPIWYIRDVFEKKVPFDGTDSYFWGLRLGHLSIQHCTPESEKKLRTLMAA
jgi:hypothetical protein